MTFKVVKNGQTLASNISDIHKAREIRDKMAIIHGQGYLITVQIEKSVGDYIEEAND